ncbi:flavodoxin FldA [Candidatus Tachikawaea gelatinosa]|uniref:Flavodoxin n=1 Tax=Candidatus Tachikawaea gelatinosa TaxID=1410383 RepID=A0A090ALR2_9ENTR|nr:flavodoxin FldA [Candidatus Tachikawaea gelatinosa]BAP58589.1 flavodoxin 1 [Candidatus Tachikawaea gelatinosa]
MEKIGIFFGSDTGNTEHISKIIQKRIGKEISKVYDISQSTKKDLEKFNILLLGIPTWYYGEAQGDWDDFLPTLKKANLKKKIIGIFGCGDQEDYTEYFCDAMRIIYDILEKKEVTFIGKWSTKGYHFESSKALIDNYFLGLVIDEDRQPELTDIRINQWVEQILEEINKINI